MPLPLKTEKDSTKSEKIPDGDPSGIYLFQKELTQQAQAVEHRLMEHINFQRVPADPVQHRHLSPDKERLIQLQPGEHPVDKIAGYEQEDPRQQGK